MKPRKLTIKERVRMARLMAKILGSSVKYWSDKKISSEIRKHDRRQDG